MTAQPPGRIALHLAEEEMIGRIEDKRFDQVLIVLIHRSVAAAGRLPVEVVVQVVPAAVLFDSDLMRLLPDDALHCE